MQPLLKFFRLSQYERQHLINTFVLLSLVRLGLLLLPFKVLQTRLARLEPQPSAPGSSQPDRQPQGARAVIWSVNVCSRYMPGHVKCLARALTTRVLLRRRGYDPALRIGVAKDTDNQLEAHAWIELQGVVVMGQVENLERFTPMPALTQVKGLT